MDPTLLFSFLAASILLTVMPGPDNIFVLTESLTKGYRNGIAISIGLVLGVLIHTLAAATGISFIIQQSATVFSVIKYLGAVYLFYLAYQASREKRTLFLSKEKMNVRKESLAGLIRTGFLMNILNPKVALFFIAFLPQFISPTGYNVTLQMVLLGILFMVQAFVIFSLISMLSGRLSVYIQSQRFWGIARWTKVSVLLVLGIAVAFSRR